MSKDIYDKEAKEWLGILLIIFLGFIVYGNSLNCEFVFDDVGIVKNNAYIKDFSFTKKFFIENITSEENSYFYRPLVMISYAIDYSIWKLNVRGYHLTNIMLHGLVALAVYWLINILFGNRFVALLTSMVFVIHPIHTETVTYISGRSDCLAGLFMILSFIFYIKRLHTEKVKFFILMIVAYIGAFLSRETPVRVIVTVKIINSALLTGCKLISIANMFASMTALVLLVSLQVTVYAVNPPPAKTPLRKLSQRFQTRRRVVAVLF